MGTHTTTRRMFLGAVAVAPVAMVPAMPALADPMATAWDAAYQRVLDVNAAIDAATEAEGIANDAVFDACAAIEPAGLIEYRWTPIGMQLHMMPLDEVATLYGLPFYTGPEGRAAEVVAGIAAYRTRRERLEKQHRVQELADNTTAALKGWKDLNAAMMRTPAPTLAALADKVALLDQCAADAFVGDILADVRRLGGC